MIPKTARAVLAAIAVLASTSCTSIETYDSVKREPTNSVDVLRPGAKIARPCKEIALLTDDGGIKEQRGIEAKFIKKAKAMGGNAVFMHTLIQSGAEPGDIPFTWMTTYQYKATVLVYTEGPDMWVPPGVMGPSSSSE